MRTGKILGIGAALSAGLIAAHAASASVQLEAYAVGSSAYSTLKLTGSAGSYSASSSSYAGLFWSSLDVTVVNSGGNASISLAFSGLHGFGYYGFLTSDTSFPAVGAGASLEASGTDSVTTNNSGTSDTFSAAGYADSNNNLFGVVSSTPYPANAVTASAGAHGASTSSFGPGASANATISPISLASAYSLTTNAIINLQSSNAYSASFTTSVTGGTPAAVNLPGSGPLTIIGGLVMVGGLAIRRRMKA
jgi:hypothetical protein